ncbi:Maf family protein [Methylohalobius crimeensis]|uniref:Maf family protein n=1 Tax=Methylohalobius crimeensis TaxID=244365 RepID=UPI0003B539FC|nr:Maf family nucleotide pyrophosphatase [Methylohalobius crimeensis]
METPPLVLASGSPYRRGLLEKLQLPFVTAAPEIDETPFFNESPDHLAMRLAAAKAKAVAEAFPQHLIIGSDQVALLGGRKLTKPGGYEAAVAQLEAASGRSMCFYSGVSLLNARTGRQLSAADVCKVHFRSLSKEAIEDYIRREQPYDCVGAFKAEGLGISLFRRIEGDDPNALIGLPLIQLIDLLGRFGIKIIGS